MPLAGHGSATNFHCCIAFTIRTCSRRTVWWVSRQSIAFQSTVLRKGAQAESAFICFPFKAGSATSLVMNDRVEVCPLSRGMLSGRRGLPSIPIPPITGRLSLFPHSCARQPIQLVLRLTCLLRGGMTGLPRSS